MALVFHVVLGENNFEDRPISIVRAQIADAFPALSNRKDIERCRLPKRVTGATADSASDHPR